MCVLRKKCRLIFLDVILKCNTNKISKVDFLSKKKQKISSFGHSKSEIIVDAVFKNYSSQNVAFKLFKFGISTTFCLIESDLSGNTV